MLVYSCMSVADNRFNRWDNGIEIKHTDAPLASSIWLKFLISLLLICSFIKSVEANDVQLSGLTQRQANPVPVSTPIDYSLRISNVSDGVNDPARIGVGIRVSVDGTTIRADSGELEISGCSVDNNFPSDFACNDLGVGVSQNIVINWLNPTPGNHTVTFTASCQWLPAGTVPIYCSSFGTSLSTTTIVGLNPTAILNPAGPIVTTVDTTPTISFDGLSSTDQDGIISSCAFRLDGGQFVNTPNCTADYTTPSPGNHSVELQVTDNHGLTDAANLTLRVLSYPEAVAGPDQQLTDTDNNGTQVVTLDASGSSDLGGNIVSYEWFIFDISGAPVATGVTATLPLAVGTHYVTLRVTDDDGMVTEDPMTVTILVAPNPPTANAGPDQQLTDMDNNTTETVTLDGTASSDSDGTIVSYQWLEFGTEIASGASASVNLSVGTHRLTLRITDNDGISGEDLITITILAGPNAPAANAGPDQQLTDTDNDTRENVTLDGTASTDSDGTILSYEWLEQGTQIATGATATIELPIGIHTLTLRVTDDDNLVAEDQLTVTITAISALPVADAGTDQTMVDVDGDGSASVVLDGSGSSDPNGTIISYTWYEGNSEIATGATPTIVLSAGIHTLTLEVTDDSGLTHQDQVTISINGDDSQLQIVSGNSLTGRAGDTLGPFTVQLADPSGTPVVERPILWHVIPENAATLSESESTTDLEGQASTTMTIQQTGVIKLIATLNTRTVEFVINSIAETPGLTANQEAIGASMDNLCPSLADKQSVTTLTAAEQDLLTTCNNLVTATDAITTLSRLAPEEVAAQGTASIEAAGTQLANINTRLVALRSGDTGMNLSGLTVNYGGIAFNQRLFDGMFQKQKKVHGGGAGDIDDLLGRWGGFIYGNINFGEKDGTDRETGFDFDTSGVTFGLDYRFNRQFVAGGALGFSRYDSDYSDSAGNLEMDAWSLSAYGTYFKDDHVYVDGQIQIGSNNYDTQRRINASGAPDQFGRGDTDGLESAFNLSAGYEYRRNALTLTPYGRLSYTRVEIDAYTEEASDATAAGFGSVLHIEDQALKSMVLAVGGNLSYNISTPSAVLVPQLRFEWEHELKDDARYINARFVHDPTSSMFAIETDEADRDYFNLGLGLSAVFSQGRSGYIFYETRLDQDDVTLHRINAGVRIEF